MAEEIKMTVSEAEAQFDALIEAAQRGARVVIVRDGHEVALVVPYRGGKVG